MEVSRRHLFGYRIYSASLPFRLHFEITDHLIHNLERFGPFAGKDVSIR
jgi:hypothetical protein